MLFVTQLLVLVALLITAVLGVVPESGEGYYIVNDETDLVMDQYRVNSPIIGDPVVSRPFTGDSQVWCTYIGAVTDQPWQPVVFTALIGHANISVTDEEGDGLVIQEDAKVFRLQQLSSSKYTSYWILNSVGLAVTGGRRGAQLTLEELDPDDLSQRWRFGLRAWSGIPPPPLPCPKL